MKSKKIIKIIAGVVIFLTLPSLLFFGFVYLKYNEDLPIGSQPEKADILAHKMLIALNADAYDATNYIEWTFKRKHHFKWNKKDSVCEVNWREYKVDLDLNNPSKSVAYIHNFRIDNEKSIELIDTATKYFNNDSFWLVAPYKVFDKGTIRRIVKQDNKDALLVTYTKGGTTPGDSYLWILDENYKPTKFKMWADILPIGGLEATWTDWKTTQSGAQLPTHHKLLFFGLHMGDVKGTK
ncbi:hypothetical protein [Olleya aquimaris]|uniref:Uncharacterized protein n=1 Tax=Olleya aquimaris TaxID=639310 RepID=A0A327R4Y8_9FLAO|nr:hypothetical protein [Olleya aquimaris]RAJ11850.1 hypothetical protein LY08_02559 [Olleya aquimaris]